MGESEPTREAGADTRERARRLVAEVERIEAKGLWSQWSREVGGQWITRALDVLREVAR
jgi:hypothetical protein